MGWKSIFIIEQFCDLRFFPHLQSIQSNSIGYGYSGMHWSLRSRSINELKLGEKRERCSPWRLLQTIVWHNFSPHQCDDHLKNEEFEMSSRGVFLTSDRWKNNLFSNYFVFVHRPKSFDFHLMINSNFNNFSFILQLVSDWLWNYTPCSLPVSPSHLEKWLR